MPSTRADWFIRCTDHKKIDQLIKDLEQMAILHKNIIKADWNDWAKSVGIITEIYPELKRFRETRYKYFRKSNYPPKEQQEIINAFNDFTKLVENGIDRNKLLDLVIIRYNRAIEGNILISKELFEPDFIRARPEYHGKYSWEQLYQFEYSSDAEKQEMADEVMKRYSKTGKVKLYGLQFRMYECRWPMSNHDLMSFVFAEFPDYPELNGLCIEIIDNADNLMEYNDPGRAASDYVLYPPSISLRYQNENVVFKLLTWMNYFYFPDMRFDFGYGNNYEVKQTEINKYCGNELLKNKGLIELLEKSYRENKYVIGIDNVSGTPLIDKIFESVVTPARLAYRREFGERLLSKSEKSKATFKNEVIYSELFKIAKDPFVGAPYFCEACGLHIGLSLDRSIKAMKYIQSLRLSELKASGFYYDIDLSNTDEESFQSKDDFKNRYFHAGFCGFCDSEKKWIEMRQLPYD